jgi:aminoglycoside phosphotransferase (APT) family kinase protein
MRRLMPGWDIQGLQVICGLPGGYSHHNYRLALAGQEYVIRLPAADGSVEACRFEGAWLRSLPAGLGADVVAFDADSGALLSRWIDAPLLVETTPSPDELVDYLVALHRRMPALDRPYDLQLLVQRWLGQAEQPGAVTRARQRLARPGDITRPCHNDLNPWNILCHPAGWRTLDWEWVGLNDPLFDLVTLAVGTGVTPADLESMATRYLYRQEPRTRPDNHRLEQALLGFWLREYAWAVDALRRGNTRAEVQAQRDSALARLRELAGD